MDPLAILLISISAIIHTYWNFVLKKSINEGADPILLHWLSAVVSVILFSIVFLFFVSSYTISFYGVALAAAGGVFFAFYVFFLNKAYAHGDLSQVYPLAKITPLFTLLIGFFYLKEVISFAALIGIIFVIFGVYAVNLKNFDFKNIVKPIISLKQTTFIFALLAAIFSAMYGLFSKLGVVEINPFVFVYLAYVFLVISYIPFLYFKTGNIVLQSRKFNKPIVQIGLLDIFGYSLIVFALSFSQLSYVFALRQMSILFSVFVGVYILKESYGKTRIVSSIIIVIGITLIALSG